MAKVKALGNIKKVIGDLIVNDIDELISILKENGLDTNDVVIAINNVELSLIDKKRLDTNDVVTIASIIHGG
ncbi:MAG: hypothetical protein QW416_00420 [Candidatus Nitrosocaldaceae archaeon]